MLSKLKAKVNVMFPLLFQCALLNLNFMRKFSDNLIIRTNNNLENFFTELLTMKILALGLVSVSAKFLKIDGLLFCSACLTMFCDGIDA